MRPEPTSNLPEKITAEAASGSYNHLEMQLGSSTTQIPDGLLAAMTLLREKPHQGVPSRNLAPHQGIDERNSTAALGLRASEHLNRVWPRYTGKERDTESGNDYMFARYYNSATGRFLSPDWSAKEEPVPYAKLEYPQTLNLYSYVLNNPMTHSDPDGHKCGDAGQPACTAPGTTATPTSPQSDAKARATQAGEAAVNFTLAATKINTAIKTAPTSETVVGGLATAYLGISATGNAVAGTLQAGGAATGHTKVAEEGAEAVSTVTSVVGFGILLKTGDMNKAATGAAVEGILTSRPEDLATGGTLERAAKVADFGQNVSKVWSSIKSTVTEWIHPVAVQ